MWSAMKALAVVVATTMVAFALATSSVASAGRDAVRLVRVPRGEVWLRK
jgi:hypothetical protein